MPAASLLSTKRAHDSHSIELLTRQAFKASQAGDWDLVDACYTERGENLKAWVSDPAVVQRLLALDELIRAALLVARAGIAGLLADTAQVKRQLRRLKLFSGQMSPTNGAVHLEA